MDILDKYLADPAGVASGTVDILAPLATPNKRPVLDLVLDKDPDAEVKKKRLEKETGLTPEAIEVDPEAADRAVRAKTINDLLDTAPITSNFASRPSNATVAQDSFEQLSTIENLWAGIKQSSARGVGGLARVYNTLSPDVPQPVFGLADGKLSVDFETFEEAAQSPTLSGRLATFLEEVDTGYRQQTTFDDFLNSPLTNFLPFALEAGIISLPEMALAIANWPAAAISLTGQIGQTRAENNGVTDASVGDLFAALPAATASIFLDRLGGRSILGLDDAIKEVGLKPLTAAVAKATGKESATELTQSAIESTAGTLGTTAGFDASKTFRQAMEGMVAGAGFGGVARTVTGSVESVVLARKASATKAALDGVKAQLDQAPLVKRAPEIAAEHVAEVMRTSGSEGVFIPADKLADYAESAGLLDDELYTKLGVADQIEEALATGGDVRMTEEAFAEHILITDAFTALGDHVSLSQDDISLAEAKLVPDTIAANISGALEESVQNLVEGAEPLPAEDKLEQTRRRVAHKAVTLAETEMGLRSIFESAEQAGLTPEAYQSWLVVLQQNAEAPRKRLADRLLAQEQRENSEAFKTELANVVSDVTETINQQPVYAALNSIGRERLDRAKVVDIIGEAALPGLPKQGGNRNIYGGKKDAGGIDPEALALTHGYINASEMLADIITAPDKNQLIMAEANKRTRAGKQDMTDANQLLAAAREELMTDKTAEILTAELDMMREAKKQGRLTPALFRRKALEFLKSKTVSSIMNPERFFKLSEKQGKEVPKLLKAGDRQGAIKMRVQQLLNFHMARESYALQKRLTSQEKWMKEQIKETKPRTVYPISISAREQLRDTLIASGFNGDTQRGMTLKDWTDLYQLARAFFTDEKNLDKFARAEDKATVTEEAIILAAAADASLKGGLLNTPGKPGLWENIKNQRKSWQLLTLNLSTILREFDAWAHDGPWFTSIRGRYDQAFRRGYMPGQKGFLRRHKADMDTLSTIMEESFSTDELRTLNKPISIPGMDPSVKMTRHTVLSVLLNSGNAANLEAMVSGKTFSEEDVRAVHAYASKADWDFAAKIWAFFETYWPEIESSVERRTGTKLERVEAVPIQTEHGVYPGGYYPIVANNAKSVFPGKGQDVEANLSQLLKGFFMEQHTRDGHTKTRTSFGDQKMLMNLSVIERHIRQVTYDLEMGDAVRDIHKLLSHKDLKAAFNANDGASTYNALQLHFQGMVTGELSRPDVASRLLHHTRTGYAVVAMGLNVPVVLLQPLGLVNTIVQVGKMNVVDAITTMATTKPFGDDGYLTYIHRNSASMEARSEAFQTDLVQMSHMMRDGVLDFLPGKNTAKFLRAVPYFLLRKAQYGVDAITWMAAKKQGMDLFEGDIQKANNHADNMVARAQGSSDLTERSLLEQGTVSQNIQQQEIIRSLMLFATYFMAKQNIKYERVGKTKMTDPISVLGLAGDLVLLYTVEAVLASILYGRWPDEDDDESIAAHVAYETIRTYAAGMPLARNIAAEVEGFRGGGLIPSIYQKIGNIINQVSQGETDIAAVKAANIGLGVILKYPAGEGNKIIDMYMADEDTPEADRILLGIFGKSFIDRHQ